MNVTAHRRGGWKALRRFVLTCWKLNLQGTMEYRANFVSVALSMAINNGVWIAFWGIYFHRFPLVKGWGFHDILMLWAVGATGIGLGVVAFGNCQKLSRMITNGELDVYLSLPKPVLLHVLISNSVFSGWGDLAFGIVLFGAVGVTHWWSVIQFIAAVLFTMILFVTLVTIANTLAFFIGSSQGLSSQIEISIVTFSTYPIDIFHGVARLLLFTVVPAGLISSLPVRVFQHFDIGFCFAALGAEALFVAVMVALFAKGLRRYASGNTMIVRQ